MPKKSEKSETKDVNVETTEAKVEVPKTKGSKAKTSTVVAPVAAVVVPVKEKKVKKEKKEAKQAGAGAEVVAEADAEDDKRQRYFKCCYNGEDFGRYSGLKPKQAANKAFTSLLNKLAEQSGGASMNKEQKKTEKEKYLNRNFRFEMVECTRGGNKKRSLYGGERTALATPIHVPIKSATGDKKTITYRFTNKLKKVKEAEETGGKKEKADAVAGAVGAVVPVVEEKKAKGSKVAKTKTATTTEEVVVAPVVETAAVVVEAKPAKVAKLAKTDKAVKA